MPECVIYCLLSEIQKIFYIGKTTQGKIRFSKHMHDFKRHKDGRYGFCSSFTVLACDDCKFLVLRRVGADEDPASAEKNAIQYFRNNGVYRLVNIMHNHG